MYKGAGEQVGIQIWRIARFRLKHWTKERYGTFYNGDSYIVLHTMENHDRREKYYHLHIWIGSNTTREQAWVALYKAEEFYKILENDLVFFIENDGYETLTFTSIFSRLSILFGWGDTTDCDFRYDKRKDYRPRLLHIKYGKANKRKRLQLYQVDIEIESLNDSDCFILDDGLTIFQFNGMKASKWSKRKANTIVDEFKALRLGRVKQTMIIDGIKDKGIDLIDQFWKYFGQIKPNSIAHGDKNDRLSSKMQSWINLQCKLMVPVSVGDDINIDNYKQQWKQICGVNDIIDMSKFDCLTCDCLFVWIGKQCSLSTKRESMRVYGAKYLDDCGKEFSKIAIICCVEGNEPKIFCTAMKKQQWKIVRLIWIAYFKNSKNKICLFTILPKDIVQHIIKLII